MLGTREERMLLVRDTNRLVASAAVRSPLMQEAEAVLISRNRNMSDEVCESSDDARVREELHGEEEPGREPEDADHGLARGLSSTCGNRTCAHRRKQERHGSVKDAARRHLERRNS